MMRDAKWRMGFAVCAAILTGCADNKQRMAELEGGNRNLGEQLTRARGDLSACQRSRDDLDRRLQGALRDAEGLRAELAGRPVPQEAAPGWTAVPGGAMIAIEENVLFAPGKNSLRDEAKRTLDGIVSTLEGEYSGKDIVVFGHTDNNPIKKSGWEDNWELSTERGLAVVRYLQSHGVSASRIVAAGCGEYRPRTDNNTEANKARNRRVEIYAINLQLEPRKK